MSHRLWASVSFRVMERSLSDRQVESDGADQNMRLVGCRRDSGGRMRLVGCGRNF